METLYIMIAFAVVFVVIIVFFDSKKHELGRRAIFSNITPDHYYISAFDKSCVGIDFNQKKIAIGYIKDVKVHDFSEIIQVDILTDKRISADFRLEIRIVTKNGTYQVLFLSLLQYSPLGDRRLVDHKTKEADEFYGYLLRALDERRDMKTDPLHAEIPAVSSPSLSSASELEKLWKLKEKGVITSDEFQAMKQKLLN